MNMLPGWMLERPQQPANPANKRAFQAAFSARDAALLPASVPRWMFLDWLTAQGWLLHGSDRDDLTVFEPRTPHDLSPDEFSKRTAVFASSDGLWAMMYALRDRTTVKRILNMALQVRQDGLWTGMQYFLSFAPRDSGVTDGRSLLRHGHVYVLPPRGFEQMPAYHWPGLGEVLEPHWVNPQAVRPVMRVPVRPEDFPLPVRLHDADRIDALAARDPWGFPWTGSPE